MTNGDGAGSDASGTDATSDVGAGTIADGSSADARAVGDGSPGDAGFCPSGLTCNVMCPGNGTTTVTGKVYDPAGNNPLYNIVVYVPAKPVQPLPSGVPTGFDSCSCAALFKSGALASTATGVDGSFTLKNVPVGGSVPVVLQAGKWRRVVHVNVNACQDNPQPDRSLTMPGTVGGDDNIPDIAVSTGGSDTLECLLLRIGLPSTEYVAGAATNGHVHVFSGGHSGSSADGGVGVAENPPMLGAPASDVALWNSVSNLMAYDITLLSSEGGETWDANPANLETYLNSGGRVFASQFHYSWFSGPIQSACGAGGPGGGACNAYSAPADWGSNLANWSANTSGSVANPIGGIVDLTLNGSSMPFPKGQALQGWLANLGALGQSGVPSGEVPIYQPRYNAVVGPSNIQSQPWITSDNSGVAGQTMYFSFNTPVNLMPPMVDGSAPDYCGRVVYSDLHVAGDPSTNDSLPTPGGCANVALSAQEKVLEFMLFDLAGCVVPDSSSP